MKSLEVSSRKDCPPRGISLFKTMRYAMIPYEVIVRSHEVSAPAFRLFVYLCLHRNKETGLCFPSLKTASDELTMAYTLACRSRRELIRKGWIEKVGSWQIRVLIGFVFEAEKCTDSSLFDDTENELTVHISEPTVHKNELTVHKNELTVHHNRLINRQINKPINKERGANKSRTPAPRGTRLPDDFSVSEEMRSWALLKHPFVDIEAETEAFIDHFKSVAGAKGVKLDWLGTWRNWIRRSKQFNRTGTVKKTFTETMEAYAKLDAKWAAEEAAIDADTRKTQIGDGLGPGPR